MQQRESELAEEPAETYEEDAHLTFADRDGDGHAELTEVVEDDDRLDGSSLVERVVTWVIVAACCGFVFYSLHPDLILATTTPTGGDMGAHVWGPRFLRDHLLPQFRLSGWTMDWYAGFPAYVFYMVVPSLLILWLAASPPIWLVPFLLAAIGFAAYKMLPRLRVPWMRHLGLALTVFAVVLVIPIPYNVAFKLIVVSGLLTLPIATCALARSLRAPFPVAPLVAVATLPFIYDKGFTILGGNGASTMAGEFAFSISLTLAIFYLAVLFKGAETGRWRALGAVLLALTVLCHIIPAIFVVIVTIVVVPFLRRSAPEEVSTEEVSPEGVSPEGVSPEEIAPEEVSPEEIAPEEVSEKRPRIGDEPWWSASKIGIAVAALIIVVLWAALMVDRSWLYSTATHSVSATGIARLQHLFPALASLAAVVFFTGFRPRLRQRVTTRFGSAAAVSVTVVVGGVVLLRPDGWTLALGALFLAGLYFVEVDWRAIRWLTLVAPVAALTTAFWMLPFLKGSTYMNDMGWEKYTRYWDYLLAVPELDSGGMPMRSIVLIVAGLGVVLSVVMKVRLGWLLGLIVMLFAWAFRYFPQYRLWNARLLPFYFLAIYLLAGVGVGLIVRFLATTLASRRSTAQRQVVVSAVGAVAVLVVVLVAILGSFKVLPGGKLITDPKKSGSSLYRWAGIDFPVGIVPDWASWNFSGVERKPAYPEFKGVVDMMRGVGETNGCGRAFWEFEPDLNRFGTTMALMMLPYYSNGCIGSMEGLYFEASSTTPFHFLMQSALSASPSRAQREMPYPDFDLDLGVKQMQLMGVRYYMAFSDKAVSAAESDQRLVKVADRTFTDTSTGKKHRWVVFEVRGIDLVEGLENNPVVLPDANDHIDGWVYNKERSPQTPAQAKDGIPGSKTPGPAVKWFMAPEDWDVFLATSGPADWARVPADQASEHRSGNPPVKVSNVKTTQDSVSFDVDRTGTPVLVRVSYFPNWKVSGASGPYRVTPNFMVVVPTSKHVSLRYGRSPADLAGVGLSALGIAGIVWLAVLDERRRRAVEA